MPNPEKYFLSQLHSHHCQLPPSDDFEYVKQVSRFINYFLISEKSLQSFLKVKSLSAIFYEKRRQVRTTHALVIHPFSEFQKLWRTWMSFVFLTSLILLPFFCAFHGPFYAKQLLAEGQSLAPFYVNLIIVFLLQCACLLHIVVTFFDGYFVAAKEEMVIHLPGIAKHYLCTFFLPDLVSSLPLDAILVFSRGVEGYAELSWTEVTLLSILPLFKFSRLITLTHYFRIVFARFHSSHSAYSMFLAVGLYFLIIHWCGCLFMLIPRWFYFQPLFTDSNDPVHNSVTYQYITCIYVCLTTLVSTGLNIHQASDVAPAPLLIVLIMLGRIYRVIILIVFLQLLSTLLADKLRYLEMMDQVAQYMCMKRFPRHLRWKIMINYTYLFQKEYIGEKKILRLLSDNLRREVLMRMHDDLIQKVFFFSGLNDDLIFDFISHLKPEIYLENDIVYRMGDVGDCMYFISFGTVAVYSENNVEVCHLHDGEQFGEISVIFQIKRMATMVAVETTELYRLEAEDFHDAVRDYPEVYTFMEKQARARYELVHDSNSFRENEILRERKVMTRVADENQSRGDPDSSSQ